MADEISISLRVRAVKSIGGANRTLIDFNPGSQTFDMTGTGVQGGVQIIGTAAEQVTVNADIGTEGVAVFQNQDATNFVVLSTASDATTPLVKLLAGEMAMFPLATGTFYAKADTGACNLYVGIVER